ncbi:MAG: hypothetical protein WCI11_20990 [Candidatus Methylumidiphilus sp.]
MSVFAFEAKLGFLNLMALKHPLGHGADGTPNHIPKRVLGVPKPSASLRLSVGTMHKPVGRQPVAANGFGGCA